MTTRLVSAADHSRRWHMSQFYQLIGYSLSGFEELSQVPGRDVMRARRKAVRI